MMSLSKVMIMAAGAALILWGLTELLFNPANLLSVLIGLIGGGLVVIILLARSRGENPVAVTREVVAAAQAVVRESPALIAERAAQEQLFRACERFVLSGASRDFGLTLQEVVQKLRGLVPRALSFSADSETTFNVLKLAREDLPRQLDAFVDMSLADRDSNRESLQKQWAALVSKLDALSMMVDQGRTEQFNTESTFIDMKFN